MTVPAEAVIAAQEAFAKVYNDPVTLAACLDAALEAAAPLIAAAERDRIRQLAQTYNAMYAEACLREDCRNASHYVHFAKLLEPPPATVPGASGPYGRDCRFEYCTAPPGECETPE